MHSSCLCVSAPSHFPHSPPNPNHRLCVRIPHDLLHPAFLQALGAGAMGAMPEGCPSPHYLQPAHLPLPLSSHWSKPCLNTTRHLNHPGCHRYPHHELEAPPPPARPPCPSTSQCRICLFLHQIGFGSSNRYIRCCTQLMGGLSNVRGWFRHLQHQLRCDWKMGAGFH